MIIKVIPIIIIKNEKKKGKRRKSKRLVMLSLKLGCVCGWKLGQGLRPLNCVVINKTKTKTGEKRTTRRKLNNNKNSNNNANINCNAPRAAADNVCNKIQIKFN